MSFGDYIRSVRKEKNMTMRELERRSGISQAYISQIENGKRETPKPITIEKFAKGLGITYRELMLEAGYIEEMPTHKLANRLKELRTENNLSIEEVAKQIKIAPGDLQKFEFGYDQLGLIIVPSEEELKKILDVYNLDINEFLSELDLNRFMLPVKSERYDLEKIYRNQATYRKYIGEPHNQIELLDIHKLFIEEDNTIRTKNALITLIPTYKGRHLTDEDLDDMKQLLKFKFKD